MNERDRSQLELFLRDCKDRPEDDTPRLVLADWLLDRGDPRGELMHLQVRPEEGRVERQRREAQLMAAHGRDWLGPLLDHVAGWVFRRGLLSLEARAERVLRDEAAALADGDHFLWVEELCLAEVRPEHLGRLATSPLLPRLAALNLGDNRIGDEGVVRLLGSPGLAGLRRLGLSRNRVGDAGAAALARCQGLAGLRELDLSRNRVGDAGAAALAESPHFGAMRLLDVSGNNLDLEGLKALRDRFGRGARLGRPFAG